MPGTLWNALYRVKRVFHEASGRDAAATDFGAMLVDFQEVVRATRSHAGNAVGAAPIPLRPTHDMHELCATASKVVPLSSFTAGLTEATTAVEAPDLLDAKPPMSAQASCAQSIPTCETPGRVPAAPQSAASYASAVAQGALLDPACSGAILLAVCRGKAAEGIDFSDDYARTVVGESVRGRGGSIGAVVFRVTIKRGRGGCVSAVVFRVTIKRLPPPQRSAFPFPHYLTPRSDSSVPTKTLGGLHTRASRKQNLLLLPRKLRL